MFPDVVKAYNGIKIYKELPDMKEKRATDFVELKEADIFSNMIYYELEEYLISKELFDKKEDGTDLDEPF